jgi:trafficking protein particle complex subunit 12
MARDRLVTTDPEDLALVLGVCLLLLVQQIAQHFQLWYLRLSCLARLRLFNQASAECNNLFSILNTIEPISSRTWLFDRLLPFELEVMQARLRYWAGDSMGYLDALSTLLRKCKLKARGFQSDITTQSMWKERGTRVTLIIASQMVEMKVRPNEIVCLSHPSL